MWHMRELAFEKNLKIWKIKSTPVFYTFQLFRIVSVELI